jgi:hypothetical protein
LRRRWPSGSHRVQAGWNPQYIVVARHPRRDEKAADRSVTEFYYVVRHANEGDARTPVSVRGPFNEFDYLQEKTRLQLPEFSKVFADLK